MYMYVYVYKCVCIHIYIYMSLSLSIYIYIYTHQLTNRGADGVAARLPGPRRVLLRAREARPGAVI